MSVINRSEISVDNEHLRIDSDYFKKEFIQKENIIKNNNWQYLGKLCTSIINFGAYSLCNQIEFLENGVPFLNVGDIKPNSIDFENAKKINESLSLNVLNKSLAKEKQVLLTIAGTIGYAAVSYKLPNNCNSNQAIANITTKEILNPFYLSVYLNSKFGNNQTKKLTISSVQPNLLLTQVKNIKVVIPSILFQEMIENIYKKSHLCIEKSKLAYAQAETLLLETLGLQNFVPSNEAVNIKSFKESFLATGRLDAEYYQRKYEQVIERIITKEHKKLLEIVNIKKSIEPGSDAYMDEGIPFLRVSDYNKHGITTPQKCLSESYYKENKDILDSLMPKANTILFSKDGSVGTAYKLREDMDLITSGAVLHLTVKDEKILNPDYLTLVLNSQLVQMQAERDAGGSIILHWRVSEIENVVVPIIENKIQQQIAEMVEESFKLKAESEKLLELAKRAVEVAIEEVMALT